MSNTFDSEDPAAARKRRIERRAVRTVEDDDASSQDDACTKRPRLGGDEEEEFSLDGEPRRKPSLRGIKKQARYEPGVTMTKEELAVWRKQARRVRNRESAAASRQKTKERIEFLEGKVSNLQTKYDAALRRIAELEAQKHDSVPPPPAPFVSVPQRVSPQPSPEISPAPAPVIPQDPISLDALSEDNLHQAASQMLLPSHDIHPSMILRPTAVCV